jgi:hypothetical protein
MVMPEQLLDQHRDQRLEQRVEVTLPSDPQWAPLVRLNIGGVAVTAELQLNEIEDLRIAVEQLLLHASSRSYCQLRFSVMSTSLRIEVGPLRSDIIAQGLQNETAEGAFLDLRHVLQVLVDAFGVTQVDGDEVWVRLEKVSSRRAVAA